MPVRNPDGRRSSAAVLLLAALSAALLLQGCGGTPERRAIEKSPPAPAASLTEGINSFGFDLLRTSRAGRKDDPAVVISPVSVHAALSMASAGAGGATRSELDSVLRTKGTGGYRSLLDGLNGSGTAELSVADSLWVQDGFPVLPAYKELCRDSFDASAENVDFADGSGSRKVNAWVSGKTKGLILSVLPDGPAEYRAVLVNAVYFKGKWDEPFGDPQPHDFTAASGERFRASMLGRTGNLSYAETPGYQIAAVPYELDDQGEQEFSMLFLLPKGGTSLYPMIGGLDGPSLAEAVGQMGTGQEVRLAFPEFEARWEGSLKGSLEVMGIKAAFSDSAEFPGISDPQHSLKVDDVLHKTYMGVDKEGTEAAAATSVGMVATAMPVDPPKVVEMVLDRPYLMLLRDDRSGAVLFMAAVDDPR